MSSFGTMLQDEQFRRSFVDYVLVGIPESEPKPPLKDSIYRILQMHKPQQLLYISIDILLFYYIFILGHYYNIFILLIFILFIINHLLYSIEFIVYLRDGICWELRLFLIYDKDPNYGDQFKIKYNDYYQYLFEVAAYRRYDNYDPQLNCSICRDPFHPTQIKYYTVVIYIINNVLQDMSN